jgi:flagellar biosynthesis protein FliR
VIDFEPVARFGILMVRPGMLMMLAPGLGGNYTPAKVKVGLTVLLALALMPAVPAASTDLGLTLAIAREVAIGMSLAFVARALIVSAEFAGVLAGQQIGFSYGATVDPASGVSHTVVATLYGTLATITFLAINGHHMLLRALAASYERMPIGSGQVDGSLVASVNHILALVFTIGVRLAAPIVIVMLIVEVGVGIISRTAPALSTMVIGFPLRLLIGLAVLAVVIAAVPSVMTGAIEHVIELALETAAAFR